MRRIVSRYPQVVANESGAPQHARSILRKWPDYICARRDLIAGRLTHRIAARRINHEPGATDGGVRVTPSFHLITYKCVLRSIGSVVRVAGPDGLRDGIDLIDRIAGPIDIHIEAVVEVMLMNRRIKLRRYEGPMSRLLTRR